MKAIDIFDGITELPAELLEEAETHRFRKSRHWLRIGAAAAALVLAMGIAGAATGRLRLPFGAAAGPGNTGGGSSGGDGGSYTYYVGPVLPLTVRDGAEGVTARRSVEYDFAPYETRTEQVQDLPFESWSRQVIVTDAYTLTNLTDRDLTLSLLYPALLRWDRPEAYPAVTVDGAVREPALYAGPYAAGFLSERGEHTDMIRSWGDCARLLADGSYQTAAFSPVPDLHVPVTVYEIGDYAVAPTDAVNPTLQFSFRLDFGKTTVLNYGSNGGSNDYDAGFCTRHVSGLDDADREPMFVLLMGEDLESYALQGYRNGGCRPGEEIDISAAVTRYETTLDAFLQRVLDEQAESGPARPPEARDMQYRLAAEFLVYRGLFSRDPLERSNFSALEEARAAWDYLRVLYFSFDVTIPAGGSVEVSARMARDASMNYYGKNRQLDGYDLAARLGSDLSFTEQRASLTHAELICMVDNNFGFDPENGVTAVTLDPETDHYWMQVTKR